MLLSRFKRPVFKPIRKRLPGVKAVTIGVGYYEGDHLILGSDMELTSAAKYKGTKDYHAYFGSASTVAAVFAGTEDDMRCVWEDFQKRINTELLTQKSLDIEDVRSLLSSALSANITDPKSKFQMLVGIAKEDRHTQFFRVFRKRIVPARGWEIIGYGDSELARYLTSQMSHTSLTPYQAVLWTAHIINIANRFVQSVGQGIRITVLNQRAQMQYLDGEMFAHVMDTMDKNIAGMWFDFCNETLSKDEFIRRQTAFDLAAYRLRDQIPKAIK